MIKPDKLRRILLVIIIVSSILVLAAPWLLWPDFVNWREELLKTLIILFFLMLIYTAYFLYFKEFKRLRNQQENLEERLQETFKYIGSINLQINEIKESFVNFKKYPVSKKDIKTVFNYFSEKILSLVNADWVILKIIDVKSGRTLRETQFSRQLSFFKTPKIENQDILAGRCYLQECTIVHSGQENLNIKTCCILPVKLVNRDQEFFVKSMINQVEMLFLVFSSLYYNNKQAPPKQSIKILS